jgi:hypothetical protein
MGLSARFTEGNPYNRNLLLFSKSTSQNLRLLEHNFLRLPALFPMNLTV